MASQQSDPALPSAQVVGNVFVQQFFHILHQSPELVHRFYQESSKLGRPGVKGEMSVVSTLQAIDEKIQSMDYNEYRAQIKTVDAQESLSGGVIVLVTGFLIGKDDLKKDFTQTFFLATQDNGYYVLNDIFRYVEDADQQQEEKEFSYEADAPTAVEHDSLPSQEENIMEQFAAVPEEGEVNEEEKYNPSENEGSVVEDEDLVDEVINEVPVEEIINEVQAAKVIIEVPVPVQEVINEAQTSSLAVLANPGLSAGHENKKSYASIVKVMKENHTLISVPTPAHARVAPANMERQVKVMKEKSTTLSVPISEPARVTRVKIEQQFANSAPVLPPASEVITAGPNVAESSDVQDSEADGYSIYIKNLPLSATPAQLEEEFKKFGPIKANGIQVRSNKLQGFCFGFVEFESAGALQSAIEASPIMIGNRQAYVEEKRTTGSRVNNRGRFLPGRGGGFRGDGMRGGGRGYGGGRGGYGGGRGDYSYRSDFSNRGGGRNGAPAYGQGDAGYQRVDHMGSNYERRSRPGSPSSRNSVAPRVPASA